MRRPFAVYTATEGYGWSAGRSHDRATLERMRRAVGKTPDFDYGASGCCGAVNDGDIVVVYRFMRADKWDSKGRNAAYLALSFFPRASAGAVDMEGLLSFEAFAKPMREPPEWLEYNGGRSVETGFVPRNGSCTDGDFDLTCAGSVFTQPFAGTLRVSRVEVAGGGRCRTDYKESVASVTREPKAEVVRELQQGVAEINQVATKGDDNRTYRRLFVAILAAVLVMFAGVAFWLLLQKDKGGNKGLDDAGERGLAAAIACVGGKDKATMAGTKVTLASLCDFGTNEVKVLAVEEFDKPLRLVCVGDEKKVVFSTAFEGSVLDLEFTYHNPFLRFRQYVVEGLPAPMIVAIAVSPGGSDEDYEVKLIAERNGKIATLTETPVELSSQDGFYLGHISKKYGVGLLVWKNIWGDGEPHYAPHRYAIEVYKWSNGANTFQAVDKMTTKERFKDGGAALLSYGFPTRNIRDEVAPPEEGFTTLGAEEELLGKGK